MQLFHSLTYRSFALLWSGQTISRLGDRLFQIALAWWVLDKTGSAAAVGAVFIFTSIPNVLFSLLGGVAVDRFSRGRVMLISDLLRGLFIGMVAWLAFGGTLEVWHIYVASILMGLVSAFFLPAYTAVIPEIVPSQGLPSANSLTALSHDLTGVVGPMMGASIVALGGTSSAFALDGLSFFISAACLLPLISLPRAAAMGPATAGVLASLREGIGTVMAVPWLWITITIAGFTNMTQAAPYTVAIPVLVKNHLDAGVGLLGLLYSAASAGSVLAAVWLGRYRRIHRRGPLGYACLVVWGLAGVALGLPLPTVGLIASAFFWGGGVSAFNLIWANSVQELVPRNLMGRVASIDSLGSFILLPIGYAITGWASDWIGAPLVLVIGGALTTTMVLLGFMHPAIRGLD